MKNGIQFGNRIILKKDLFIIDNNKTNTGNDDDSGGDDSRGNESIEDGSREQSVVNENGVDGVSGVGDNGAVRVGHVIADDDAGMTVSLEEDEDPIPREALLVPMAKNLEKNRTYTYLGKTEQGQNVVTDVAAPAAQEDLLERMAGEKTRAEWGESIFGDAA